MPQAPAANLDQLAGIVASLGQRGQRVPRPAGEPTMDFGSFFSNLLRSPFRLGAQVTNGLTTDYSNNPGFLPEKRYFASNYGQMPAPPPPPAPVAAAASGPPAPGTIIGSWDPIYGNLQPPTTRIYAQGWGYQPNLGGPDTGEGQAAASAEAAAAAAADAANAEGTAGVGPGAGDAWARGGRIVARRHYADGGITEMDAPEAAEIDPAAAGAAEVEPGIAAASGTPAAVPGVPAVAPGIVGTPPSRAPLRMDEGFVNQPSGGRADEVEVEVPENAYVLPADVVAGLGQGNSTAGAKRIDQLVKATPRAKIAPARRRRIKVSGGEYVLSPATVAALGRGDPRRGGSSLDKQVLAARKLITQRMRKLPGPVAV